MYNNANGFTVSGKNRFSTGSDSTNIIMVRLKKRNPVSLRQESRVAGMGILLEVIRYFNLVPVTEVKTAMFRKGDLQFQAMQYKKIKSRGSKVFNQ